MGARDNLRAGPVEAASADRLLASLQRKKQELDGQLAELRERQRVLLAYLESNGYQHSETAVWPADRVRKLDSREGELGQCLVLLKLRCQLMAEELTEITLLAEALYALSSSPAAPTPAASALTAPASTTLAPTTSVPTTESGMAPSGGATAAPASPAPSGGTTAPPAVPPAVPPTDALARLLSNPQIQKMATQMLAQFLKN